MDTLEKVREIVADALYLELDEVHPHSTLMRDLGAESIDFLDLMFRLEKEFDIKIPKGDIEKRARGNLTDDEFAIDGRIQDKGLEQLRKALPEVNGEDIQPGLFVRDISSLFTVATFQRMVDEQLASNQDVAAKSGSTERVVARRADTTIAPRPLS